MTDHGFDLEALQAHGHSIFSPSSSPMWLFCSGSLIPNILAEDDAGEDAAYGTVGHSVGEEWLLRYGDELKSGGVSMFADVEDLLDETEPLYLIGRVVTIKHKTASFDITIDQEMLSYVREYVRWCATLPGTHYVETKVNYENLTPIKGQGGTADHAACAPRVLTVTDLKMGKGIRVYAEWNTQALLYAYGFFRKYDYKYNFERIIIRIGQPRLEHFDVWEISREDLLAWVETVPPRARAAWVPNAPRTPGEKQCQWCKVKKTCAAHLAWYESVMDKVADDTFEDESEDGVIEGEYSVVEMEGAQKRLLAGKDMTPARSPAEMTTAAMAKLLPYRKQIEKFFEAMSQELYERANGGEEVPGYKMVEGRLGNREWIDKNLTSEDLEFMGLKPVDFYDTVLKSPAQIEELLHKSFPGLTKKNAALSIADLITRKSGKPTLVPDADKRVSLEDRGDVFEDESPDDEL